MTAGMHPADWWMFAATLGGPIIAVAIGALPIYQKLKKQIEAYQNAVTGLTGMYEKLMKDQQDAAVRICLDFIRETRFPER